MHQFFFPSCFSLILHRITNLHTHTHSIFIFFYCVDLPKINTSIYIVRSKTNNTYILYLLTYTCPEINSLVPVVSEYKFEEPREILMSVWSRNSGFCFCGLCLLINIFFVVVNFHMSDNYVVFF